MKVSQSGFKYLILFFGSFLSEWKKHLKFITDILVKMDDFVTRRFPNFNRYGYYCVIGLVKGDNKKLTARHR